MQQFHVETMANETSVDVDNKDAIGYIEYHSTHPLSSRLYISHFGMQEDVVCHLKSLIVVLMILRVLHRGKNRAFSRRFFEPPRLLPSQTKMYVPFPYTQ